MKTNLKNLFTYCILPIVEVAIVLFVVCLILWLFNGGNFRDYTGNVLTNVGLIIFSIFNLIYSNTER